jgi:phosphoribosylamine--glycine ligase
MESDIMEPIIGVIAGDISRCVIKWKTDACVCVVIASGGYPDRYEKGFEISGLNDVEDAVVFHAGTILEDGNILTSGGRVLGVTALGADIQNAIDKCYSAIEKLSFKNMHYRKDIGKKAVRRVK